MTQIAVSPDIDGQSCADGEGATGQGPADLEHQVAAATGIVSRWKSRPTTHHDGTSNSPA
jgi:hypothetical protein